MNKEFEVMIGDSRDKLIRMHFSDLMKMISCPVGSISIVHDILNSVFTGKYK